MPCRSEASAYQPVFQRRDVGIFAIPIQPKLNNPIGNEIGQERPRFGVAHVEHQFVRAHLAAPALTDYPFGIVVREGPTARFPLFVVVLAITNFQQPIGTLFERRPRRVFTHPVRFKPEQELPPGSMQRVGNRSESLGIKIAFYLPITGHAPPGSLTEPFSINPVAVDG